MVLSLPVFIMMLPFYKPCDAVLLLQHPYKYTLKLYISEVKFAFLLAS